MWEPQSVSRSGSDQDQIRIRSGRHLLLALLDDDAPGVLLVAVHDVLHPALDLGRVLAGLALAEGDVHVGAAVVDLGDGADEELLLLFAHG